jgi:uncharacterized protein (TIGR02996 family)
MSDSAARGFLEDILAHPDDNTPRLIFADWLDEHGDSARAEFIRVQVERATLPKWDARQVRLRLRERALIEEYGDVWKAELPRIKGIAWEEFRRGFVATATVSSFAALGAGARACWAAAPIEAISLRWPRQVESKKSLAPISGLRELSITGQHVDYWGPGRLADAPLLSTLRTLNISNCGLSRDGFRRLLASPHLGNLTALRVPLNRLGNLGVRALFDAKSMKSLTELDLSESGTYGTGRYREDPVIGAAGLTALAMWPGMTRIRSLTLSGNSVKRDGLRALLRSPPAAGLKELVLRHNELPGQAMAEFGTAHRELKLEVLDLGENPLGDLGPADLALAPCLAELKVLALDRCETQLSGARWLTNAPFVASLRRLNVDYNSFAPEGLYRLLEKEPPWLHTLQMVDNDLGDEGAAHLAESPASDPLLEVDFGQNGVADAGARALAKSKHLRNLRVLRLRDNPISKRAADALTRSALGKRIAILEMAQAGEGELPF